MPSEDHLNKEEINDLIIALTNLNNEIAEFERQTKYKKRTTIAKRMLRRWASDIRSVD